MAPARLGVKDRQQADAALVRIAAGRGLTGTPATHQGVEIAVANGAAWALLEDLLIIAPDEPGLTAALDAELWPKPLAGR